MQAVAALLDSPTPVIALHAIAILNQLVRVFSTAAGKPIFDPQRGRLLFNNPLVLDPLIGFCITYASSAPMSDLEWVAVQGKVLFLELFRSVELRVWMLGLLLLKP